MASHNLINLIAMIVFASMIFSPIVEGGLRSNVIINKFVNQADVSNGTKWALLIAGSNDFSNYRHQADICHAYHILKKGGLKDENIIVFMYDDIAYSKENPRQGVIINHPRGENVYPGVPKDYTGKHVNARNIYAAILGNKNDINGGSGKVLTTNPNDHIFIYYADHGGPGVLGMPDYETTIFANDFIDILKKKHVSKSYKSMVIYLEACEAGSIFDGLLPNNLSIYAITASNPNESSYACYCHGRDIPPEYQNVCLGDLFSVAWMEDSDKGDSMKETLDQQFFTVRDRTGNSTEEEGTSHVMRYGDLSIGKELLAGYIGSNSSEKAHTSESSPIPLGPIEQREADLLYLKQKVKRSEEGSIERIDAQKKLDEEISHRKHVDMSVASIGQVLFGKLNSLSLQNTTRPAGQPLVDDWDCYKSMVGTYEAHCGSLRNYGRKYLRFFANMCNAGSHKDQMEQAAARVCAV